VSAESLLEVLQSVPDPRDPRGLQHPLSAILSLTVVAVLAGMKSLSAIAQFGRERGAAFAFALGFTKGKTPAKSCLSELFAALDAAALEDALARWLLGRVAAGWRAIAVGGKTLKGSADGAVPGVHLLSAFAPDAGAVLKQARVDAKTNEHKAALRLLGVLPLAGKVVTGDAMFTHKDVAGKIRQAGGDYVLIVKDNQGTLKGDIHAALHDDAGFSPLPA
jgi:DDE_Tnp_1-associated/Transposase DDE domain